MNAPVDPCVVDTNVPLTANGGEDPKCILACIDALRELMRSGHIVIDDKYLILKEYMHKLSPSGQPGVGDAFLKWVLNNQANVERCTQVPITPRQHDQDFVEFPSEAALSHSASRRRR